MIGLALLSASVLCFSMAALMLFGVPGMMITLGLALAWAGLGVIRAGL